MTLCFRIIETFKTSIIIFNCLCFSNKLHCFYEIDSNFFPKHVSFLKHFIPNFNYQMIKCKQKKC